MQLTESVRMAFNSLRGNKLRAGLTLLSMAIGVFAIVGVAASVEALQTSLGEQLVTLGSNDFRIQRNEAIRIGNGGGNRGRRYITVRQGLELKRRLEDRTEAIGLMTTLPGKTIEHEGESTDPNVSIMGADENFLVFSGYTLHAGRIMTPDEARLGSDVVVLGSAVADDLGVREGDIGTSISVGGHYYSVIGIAAPKGSMMGQSQDNFVMIPITSAMKYFFNQWGTSIQINVRTGGDEEMEELQDEAIGIMRAVRHLQIGEENDFTIVSQQNVAETLGGLSTYLSFFGFFCGAIALLAAGVGIMNIMLVSVKERTKEIGIRKAIGATRSDVLSQFIIEAVTICQIGAGIGILAGVGVGLLLGSQLGVAASFPWNSIIVSSVICLVIGVGFGAYPARKASKLDPIDALRYE